MVVYCSDALFSCMNEGASGMIAEQMLDFFQKEGGMDFNSVFIISYYLYSITEYI